MKATCLRLTTGRGNRRNTHRCLSRRPSISELKMNSMNAILIMTSTSSPSSLVAKSSSRLNEREEPWLVVAVVAALVVLLGGGASVGEFL